MSSHKQNNGLGFLFFLLFVSWAWQICSTDSVKPTQDNRGIFVKSLSSKSHQSAKDLFQDVRVVICTYWTEVPDSVLAAEWSTSSFSPLLLSRLNFLRRTSTFTLSCDDSVKYCACCSVNVPSTLDKSDFIDANEFFGNIYPFIKTYCDRNTLFSRLLSIKASEPQLLDKKLSNNILHFENTERVASRTSAKIISLSFLKKYLCLDRRKYSHSLSAVKLYHIVLVSNSIQESSIRKVSRAKRSAIIATSHESSEHIRTARELNTLQERSHEKRAKYHSEKGHSSDQQRGDIRHSLPSKNEQQSVPRKQERGEQREQQLQQQQRHEQMHQHHKHNSSEKIHPVIQSLHQVPNRTLFEDWVKNSWLQRQVQKEGQYAYLCLVFIICLMLFSLWYFRGFHNRNAKKEWISFHDKSHMLTVKEVLFRKAKYLPMFTRYDGLEEVFVHDCGNDP